jgi:hypothetical protein
MSMPLTENGVSVHFPDANYFQFDSCAAYTVLKGHSVKEMDICWLDATKNTLWAVELKAFDNPANAKHIQSDLNDQNVVNRWIDELFKKSLHTLCMLETNRSNTHTCLPAGINVNTSFRLVHLINVISGQETLLSFMQDELRIRLKPLLAVFRVESLSVIPYSVARGGILLPWIV